MKLIKYCAKDFHPKNCNTIQIGTLNYYRNSDSEFIADPKTLSMNEKTFNLLLYFFLFIIPINLFSQNLVLNPSFEEAKKCNDFIGYLRKNAAYWSCPNKGTSDFFNSCTEIYQVDIPENYRGTQNVKFGENYVGAEFYNKSKTNHREYIQGELSEKLVKGETYNVSFFISLSEFSNFAIKEIGVLFTDKIVSTNIFTEISEKELKKLSINRYSYHKIDSNTFYDDKSNWIQLTKNIVATGDEKYIIIGNFIEKSKTNTLRVSDNKGLDNPYYKNHKYIKSKKNKKTDNAYYFIDMISVELLNDTKEKGILPAKEKKQAVLETNKNYVFKNVIFDYNDIKLNKKAKLEIQSLYSFLKDNINAQITISGHTDNIGNEKFNKTLSKQRAESVSDYLIELGLNRNRIKSFGYGDSKPIEANKTEEGRNKNRRVEFKIVNNN